MTVHNITTVQKMFWVLQIEKKFFKKVRKQLIR